MPASPAPADPGWDDDLAWLDRDPMTAQEREASLDRLCEQDEGYREDEADDYGAFEPFTAEELAEIRHAAADELLAVEAAATGRRGPGQPGSARVFPGESASPAASFGPGMALDVLPGCAQLAVAAGNAAGEDGNFAGVSEAELAGVLAAWDRVEAHAAARKLGVAAELARRNPAPPDAEFTADQVAYALAESRGRAGNLVDLARTLQTRLPGTAAALEDGTVTRYKAEIIARATALLEDAGARAAEDKVLDRAARLTPGGLRAAIAHAVMEADPEKARERREAAARDARVERWAEDSGNAALMGCELPPDEVLAADQRITAWAKELRQAGLEGGMDVLRARAFLDLLLGKDSRPRRDAPLPSTGPAGGAAPAGFAGRVTLTVPLATLLDLADRPGEIPGIGPVDPWLARDLAAAAARNPRTTWCVTVTDAKGHAVGHGCARPEPKAHRQRAGPGPPGETGFRFTPASRDGPPGGYGSWRLRTPGPGAGPDHHPGIADHRPVRPPAPGPRPRSRGHAKAPVPGPARHLHQSGLPAARRPVRRGPQHPLRDRRPDLPLQYRPQVPPRPPAQAAPEMDSRPAPRRHLPLDHPSRAHLHHRTHPVPHLMRWLRRLVSGPRRSQATAALPGVGLRDGFHSQHR